MSPNTHHPYNNIFVKTMSIPHFVERIIEHLAVDLKGKIKPKSYKLATETYIDELLKPHLPDVIYEAQYEQSAAWLFLLFEHKSNLEHVKVQIGRYTFIGLHQQKIKWEQENVARRKAKKTALKKFKYKLILPIVLYHGQQKWKNRPFAELFDLPDDSFHQYLPDFNYILLDLTSYTDEYLEQIGDPLLAAILLLLKHKGDKEYVKQNAKKIFKFVELNPGTTLTKDFLETLIQFIYQTFTLKQTEVQDIITVLPTKIKTDMVSTWDMLIEQGKIEGIQIGKAEGIQIGKAEEKVEMNIKKTLEFTLNLIKGLPAFTDTQIAAIGNVKPTYVKKVRTVFSRKRSSSIKIYIRQLFKKTPSIEEKKWKELEKWGLELWEAFKKAQTKE